MTIVKMISTLVKTAPLIHAGTGWASALKRAKYFVRGLLFARQTRAWFAELQTPVMSQLVRQHPYLFHKLQRPYLHRRLRTRHRLAALQQHYSFVTNRLTPALLAGIYAPAGMRLAKLHAGAAGNLELRLSSSQREKEGDLMIALQSTDSGAVWFTLSFSVVQSAAGEPEIFIGGLQGDKCADKHGIVALTRGMHGMRPKALLWFTLQQLAACWGINHVRAVSDALHVYRHFQKKRILSASYDAFWLECAGRLAADGLFDLPVVFVARESASLKANKRPMYKRRYAQLSDLAEQIKTRISLAQGARPVFHWHETLVAPEPQPVAGLHALPQRAVSAADKICEFDS